MASYREVLAAAAAIAAVFTNSSWKPAGKATVPNVELPEQVSSTPPKPEGKHEGVEGIGAAGKGRLSVGEPLQSGVVKELRVPPEEQDVPV